VEQEAKVGLSFRWVFGGFFGGFTTQKPRYFNPIVKLLVFALKHFHLVVTWFFKIFITVVFRS